MLASASKRTGGREARLADGHRLEEGTDGGGRRDLAIKLQGQERLTTTYEKVGTTDWMPGWALGMRLEDVKPSFDVFSLGKVLWSMVSGRERLRLWYFMKPEFNLTHMFPDSDQMEFVNGILAKTVVEEPEHCLASASEMLEAVDGQSRLSRPARSGQVGPRECDADSVARETTQRRRSSRKTGSNGLQIDATRTSATTVVTSKRCSGPKASCPPVQKVGARALRKSVRHEGTSYTHSAQAIKAVTFGEKASAVDRDRVLESMRVSGLDRVPVFTARRERTVFKVRVMPDAYGA